MCSGVVKKDCEMFCQKESFDFDPGSGQEADDANEVNDNEDEDDDEEDDEDNKDGDDDEDEDVNLVGG